MNKQFVEEFIKTRQLIDENKFRNKVWRDKVIDQINVLKPLFPKGDWDLEEFAQKTNQVPLLIQQIFFWTLLPEEELRSMLKDHGSIHFDFLSQYLPYGVEEEILEELEGTKVPSANSRYLPSKLTELLNAHIPKRRKDTSKEEVQKLKFDSLDFEVWKYLNEDAKSWDADAGFIRILKTHSAKKSNFSIKETTLLLEVLQRYSKQGYLDLDEADSPKAKRELYKELKESL